MRREFDICKQAFTITELQSRLQRGFAKQITKRICKQALQESQYLLKCQPRAPLLDFLDRCLDQWASHCRCLQSSYLQARLKLQSQNCKADCKENLQGGFLRREFDICKQPFTITELQSRLQRKFAKQITKRICKQALQESEQWESSARDDTGTCS